MFATPFLHSGSHQPAPLELRAGPLSMLFEPHTAFLRRIRLGDHEVVRALYAAIRNHDWATIPPRVTLRESRIEKDSFRLLFDCDCRRGEIHYFWQGEIIGEPNGRIRYTFTGEARSNFRRNRIGICILHPITECAGNPVVIEHVDGTTEQGSFPREISPNQPFFDIRALSYEIANTGISARLAMQGDTFEMEDQRNWTDASFKTYCTPLSLPLPHDVHVADRVQQSVELTLSGNVRPVLPVNVGRPPQLSIATTPVLTLPPLGFCVASHGAPLTEVERERLKLLKPSHLRVDLRLDDPALSTRLNQASAEATALGASLHVALILCEQADKPLPQLLQALRQVKPSVSLWIILHESENPTTEGTVQKVRGALQEFAPSTLCAAGTTDFFTEVNRVRLPPGAASFICYSNNPQVHAFDHSTMVENLAGQVYNVESARHFTSRPVVVSPITLRIRNNAGSRAEKAGSLAELPSDVDPRQLSLFGAGWTLASIARLTNTGFVHSLTYYETTGWRGLMETAAGSLLPEAFPSEPGVVFPIFHVFADIAEFSGRTHSAGTGQAVYPTFSSHPLLADALTLVDSNGKRRVLVANLSGDVQELKIKSGTSNARVRMLDETTAEMAARRPEEFRKLPGELQNSVSGKIELRLLPYAVARVDLE